MTSIKCAYVVWLSLQLMLCGFHLAIFSLIFFYLASILLQFSLNCDLIIFFLMMFDCFLAYVVSHHFTLNWSSLPSWWVADWKEQIWHLGQAWFPLNKQQTHTKRGRKGEINKDNTKIGGILNRRFWQLGQAWFPLTLKTREQKKDQNYEQGQYKKRITNGKFNS